VSTQRGALFVMPSPSHNQSGPVATWITTAGWAAAAEKLLGQAWICSPDGVLSAEQARKLASRPSLAPQGRSTAHGLVYSLAATAKYDLRQWHKARRFSGAAREGPWSLYDLAFVWQRHDLFHTAGFEAARTFGKPLVLFVDAPLVWETKKWGIGRPGWGWLVERLGERPQFRKADLVACVSEEVADQVVARGARDERIMVTPCSVDTDVFTPGPSDRVKESLGLSGKFVIGWVGSFRRFHGVEMALQATAALRSRIPGLALLLVGDGRERPRMQKLTETLGLRDVVFTGTVFHQDIPQYLQAMDVALLMDDGQHQFHYSPLKLKEYMACAKAIVAPRVGEMARVLADGRDALLIPPGDVSMLVRSIERLHDHPELRRALERAARQRAEQEGSWRLHVERLCAVLEETQHVGA
jgi:glycosyltransferase involved in cell wall biosynthesis